MRHTVSARQAILRPLAQGVVAQHQRSHGLDHGHGARHHAGVMPAAGGQHRILAARRDGLLRVLAMVAVGLKATRKTMGSPLLMPP